MGGHGQENVELEVVDEEETKEHAKQEERRNVQASESHTHLEKWGRRGWRRRRWMNSQGKKRKRRRTATRCNTQQGLDTMWVRKPKRGA